jgi:hypothetical protein
LLFDNSEKFWPNRRLAAIGVGFISSSLSGSPRALRLTILELAGNFALLGNGLRPLRLAF